MANWPRAIPFMCCPPPHLIQQSSSRHCSHHDVPVSAFSPRRHCAMDDRHFDALTRFMSPSRPRRSVITALAVTMSIWLHHPEAQTKRRGKKRKNRKNKRCPSGSAVSAQGTCSAPCGAGCSGCCRDDGTCVFLLGLSDRDCGFFGVPCLDCGDTQHVDEDRTHCCGNPSSDGCAQCCNSTHCQHKPDKPHCCDNSCQECCTDGHCAGNPAGPTCCAGNCQSASCCCGAGEECVTPWNGAPQDQHCCATAHVCAGSQTGCCGPGLTCTPRIDPPPGTPTHACVT